MHIILNNAKALLNKKLKSEGILFSKILIQFNTYSSSSENNVVFFMSEDYENPAAVVPFDRSLISSDGCLDSRYFSTLIQNTMRSIYPKSTAWLVSIILPTDIILSCSLKKSSLPLSQLEREAIYYFQHTHHIDICQYEFFVDKERQTTMAVKKLILESIRNCFIGINLTGSLQFIMPPHTQ